MIEIDKLSLEEWLTCLKPYQQDAIKKLVASYGEEEAAKAWLMATGPIQTATFGGVNKNFEDSPIYWNRFKNEFDKLICGHPDYHEEQKKLLGMGKTIGLGCVTNVANYLAPIINMDPALIVPSLVLVLHITAKMGVRAYCSTKNCMDS